MAEEERPIDSLEETGETVDTDTKEHNIVNETRDKIKDKLKEEFLSALKEGKIDDALEIKDELGEGIDFTAIPGYADSVKKGFVAGMSANLEDAKNIKDKLGEGIDFTDSIKKEFITALERVYIDNALEIKDKLGEGIDFTDLIKKWFITVLEGGDIYNGAIRIKDELGEGIDFTAIPGYTNSVKKGFITVLEEGDIEHAIKIKNKLREGIYFTDPIKKGFIMVLEKGKIDTALKIKSELGEGIDFTSLLGYEQAVKKGLIVQLEKGKIDDALKIKSEFGKGIDFTSLPGYTDSVKKGLIVQLEKGKIDDALRIKNKLGEGIDFTLLPGYTDLVKKRLIVQLEKGGIYNGAPRIKDELGEGIDFTTIPGYTDLVKKRFITALEKGWKIDSILKIKDELGEGIDFRSLPEYKDAIETRFLTALIMGHVDSVFKIKDELGEGIDFTAIPGYINAIKEGFIAVLGRGEINHAIGIKDKLGEGIDFTDLIKKEFIRALERESKRELIIEWRGSAALRIKSGFGKGIDFTLLPGYTDLVKKRLMRILKGGRYIDEVFKIKDGLGEGIDFTAIPGYTDSVKERFIMVLEEGKIDTALKIKNKLGEGIDFTDSVKERFIMVLEEGKIDTALKIKNKLGEGIDFTDSVKKGLIVQLEKGKIDTALKIKSEFGEGILNKDFFSKELTGNSAQLYALLKSHNQEDTFIAELKNYESYLQYLHENNTEWNIDSEDLDLFRYQGSFITALDLHKLKDSEFSKEEFESKKGDEKFKYLWEQCKKAGIYTNEILNNNFKKGAEVFGYKKMFKYVGRNENNNFHDHLFLFSGIIKLYKKSGLSEKEFYSNILDQIAKDGGYYGNGKSHHHFNSIVDALENANFSEIIEEAKEFNDIKKLSSLVNLFTDTSNIFKNWANLQKFYELHEMLKRKELLDELRGLKDEKGGRKEKLYNYIEGIAFHSGISMEKTFMFWKNPKGFLGLKSSYTPPSIHNMKKPSNYTDIPHLDLTAENMRDALVEGKLDKLQSWEPFKLHYQIPTDKRFEILEKIPLSKLVLKAVGRNKGLQIL